MTEKLDDSSVRVAMRIRPQLARERIDMCQVCTSVIPGEQQVLLGKDKAFTFDYVFDMDTQQDHIYNQCVRPLIEGCFDGYNATVFAYGQTGSGKTYTMGTGFDINVPLDEVGIIPRAVEHLFNGIESRKRESLARNEPMPDFKVNAQFMELYNEEVLDLLDTTRDPSMRGHKSHIKIHEDAIGGIYVVGVTTRAVNSLDDTLQLLKVGALSRATASTNMNVQSSRSHAIFTLHIKQHRLVRDESLEKESDSTEVPLNEFETLSAKFHFVDLAGSERLKRTGATGDRQKEGISINCGLLALGNVISALGDNTKKGSHVPYRDSKLTRLLQDSLGGNSRTLMIACISPSDRDFVETLNSLKYANRARNIKNKVVANQDKTSRQLAALRSEIADLQNQLSEYQSGKRQIDGDGVESINDMFHENTMLQNESDKLRQRIKALNEVVENLTARNSQLMMEKAALILGNIPEGESFNEQVQKLIEGYVKEIEELRTKLADSDAMYETIKRQRTPSRIAASPLLSPVPVAGSFNGPLSPDGSFTSILEEAKRDVKRLKKTKRSRTRLSQSSDKENMSDNEKNENEAELQTEENEEKEKTEKETGESGDEDGMDVKDVNGDDEEDDDEEMDEMDETSDSESEDKDSDNIHEDLAELTCEISIKQRLIEELETAQKRLHSVKQQYEDKVVQLQSKIKETEVERDTVLANMNHVESLSAEKGKKIRDEFERKLNELKNELKKMQAMKKDHQKLLKNQSHYDKQLKTLQHEMGEMKKTKVRLMKQIKEDGEKNKQSEHRRNKEIAQLRKDQLRKENVIKTLEKEKQQKETVLKRKQEEVEALRKKQKPMSSKVAGRIAKYDRPNTIPIAPITSSPRRRRRGDFSPRLAKQKWVAVEKNLTCVIVKRQTISNFEKDMEIWLKHREKITKKVEKYVKRRDQAAAIGRPPEMLQEFNEVIETLRNQVGYAQENIAECQTNLMQMEETKEDGEGIDISAMIKTCNVDEARYLLERFVQMSINKGLLLSQKESETRELEAKLHQTELNNTLQQDLLKHMLMDHVDIEVDNLMTDDAADDADEVESSTSSSSVSPVDSMFDSQVAPQVPPSPVRVGIIPTAEQSSRKEKDNQKARRKTSTPEDLLYAGTTAQAAPKSLLPVPEERVVVKRENMSNGGGEHILKKPEIEIVQENSVKVEPTVVKVEPTAGNVFNFPDTNGDTDSMIMPPPKAPAPKPPETTSIKLARSSSGSRLGPGPSPVLPRKELSRPSPEPSPVLRRKNSYTFLPDRMTRSSSVDTTSSDTTPPGSPPSGRRARTTDENVFSRLTSNQQGSASSNRGTIVPSGGRFSINKTSPLLCTHTAEGHTKAVLSVCATDDLLFTSSKDRTAKAWDLQTGKELLSFTSHPNNVVRVKYCEQRRLVFTVSHSYVSVWDIRDKTSKCIKTLSSSGLTQNGPLNFAASRQIELPPGEHHINDIALNRDGSILYSATGNVVRVWDLKRFSAIGKLSGGHQAAVMVLAVDQDETKNSVVTGSKDHYIKVFEVIKDAAGVLTPKCNLEPPHYDGIQSLALHGDTLFSGSRDTCIKKWDLREQQLKQSVNSAHKDWVTALDFMQSSNTLLSGCRSGYLKLWQVDNCSQLAEIKAHTSPINAIATNSTSIFTASNDHTVAIWRPKSSDPSDSSDNISPDDRQNISS